MFHTEQVGKKIAELRKQNNMTQFELADRLNISFQAVSNWERGNSMPDISKLPEIAELFHTTIDDILGKENTLLSDIANGKTPDLEHCSSIEADEAAAITPPQKLTEIIEETHCNAHALSAFLPFLGDDYIHQLAEQYRERGENIAVFLPFLRDEYINQYVKQYKEKGESIAIFLPFLRTEIIDEMAVNDLAAGKPVQCYFPFMSDEKLKTFAFAAFEKDGIKSISQYLPFMKEEDIHLLLEQYMQREAAK